MNRLKTGLRSWTYRFGIVLVTLLLTLGASLGTFNTSPASAATTAWSHVAAPTLVTSLLDVNGTVYAGAQSGVWSYNGAWTEMTGSPGNVFSLLDVSGTVYAGTNNGSDDVLSYNGSSWTQMNNSPSKVYSLLDVSGTVYAGTTNGSNDVWSYNGSSWTQVDPSPSNVPSLLDVNGMVYAGTGNGSNDVWSYNGSWTDMSGSPGYVCCLLDVNGTLYVGTHNGVYTTILPVTPTISTQPVSQTVTAGGTATFTMAATSNDGGTLSYQWRSSTDSGSTWSNVTGGTGASTDSYTTGTLTTADSGTEYDCVVTDSVGGPATSNAATVTVNAPATSSGGGGGGGGSTVNNDNGTGTIIPSVGGTVWLNGEAGVTIPEGALQGNSSATVSIQSVSPPPAPPAGCTLIGAYEFTVNGGGYTFNSPVTLTFTFEPSQIPAGDVSVVEYYDNTTGQWVQVQSTVSGDTITVTVDHFTTFAVMAKAQTQAAPAPLAPVSVTLSDIAGNWAQTSIEKLVALGAITGYPNGSFRPNNDITRAEFVTVLVKALKLAPKSGPVFADTEGIWAQSYISTAAAYGIASGYDSSHFGPNDPITREQMTAMVVRAAKLAPVAGRLAFKDAAQIDPWAKGVR